MTQPEQRSSDGAGDDVGLVAFYGTLRRGTTIQRELGVEDMVAWQGVCHFEGVLHDMGEYPALTPGDGSVVGDLYRVLDPALFEILDPYEGFWPQDLEGSFYLRELYDLTEPTTTAWMYVYNRTPPPDVAIRGGDWLRHGQQKTGALRPSERR